MNKFTIGAIIVILACFGGLVAWSTLNSQKKSINYNEYDVTKIISADDNNGQIGDHVRGKSDSKVVLVEYADLQCPGCAVAMPRVDELFASYGDRVAFVYRNFPISGHQNARAAAAAAESAGFQGYYWEMVNALYTNRAAWISEEGTNRTNEFITLFKQAAPNGDVTAFTNGMSDARIDKKVNFDYNLGKEVSKVTATPSFYVNGQAIDFSSVQTQDELK